MNIGIYSVIGGILALLSGLAVGYLLNHLLTNKRISSARTRAENLLTEAKNKAQDLVLEAKNNSFKLLEDAKKVEEERHKQLVRIESMVTKRESELETRAREMDKERQEVAAKTTQLNELKSELEVKLQAQNQELEKIAGMKNDEARGLLFKNIEKEYGNELAEKMRKFEQSNKEELDKKAGEIFQPIRFHTLFQYF